MNIAFKIVKIVKIENMAGALGNPVKYIICNR